MVLQGIKDDGEWVLIQVDNRLAAFTKSEWVKAIRRGETIAHNHEIAARRREERDLTLRTALNLRHGAPAITVAGDLTGLSGEMYSPPGGVAGRDDWEGVG